MPSKTTDRLPLTFEDRHHELASILVGWHLAEEHDRGVIIGCIPIKVINAIVWANTPRFPRDLRGAVIAPEREMPNVGACRILYIERQEDAPISFWLEGFKGHDAMGRDSTLLSAVLFEAGESRIGTGLTQRK